MKKYDSEFEKKLDEAYEAGYRDALRSVSEEDGDGAENFTDARNIFNKIRSIVSRYGYDVFDVSSIAGKSGKREVGMSFKNKDPRHKYVSIYFKIGGFYSGKDTEWIILNKPWSQFMEDYKDALDAAGLVQEMKKSVKFEKDIPSFDYSQFTKK